MQSIGLALAVGALLAGMLAPLWDHHAPERLPFHSHLLPLAPDHPHRAGVAHRHLPLASPSVSPSAPLPSLEAGGPTSSPALALWGPGLTPEGLLPEPPETGPARAGPDLPLLPFVPPPLDRPPTGVA